jgi:hypothetical protein
VPRMIPLRVAAWSFPTSTTLNAMLQCASAKEAGLEKMTTPRTWRTTENLSRMQRSKFGRSGWSENVQSMIEPSHDTDFYELHTIRVSVEQTLKLCSTGTELGNRTRPWSILAAWALLQLEQTKIFEDAMTRNASRPWPKMRQMAPSHVAKRATCRCFFLLSSCGSA